MIPGWITVSDETGFEAPARVRRLTVNEAQVPCAKVVVPVIVNFSSEALPHPIKARKRREKKTGVYDSEGRMRIDIFHKLLRYAPIAVRKI